MKTSEELKKFIETELKHCQRDIEELIRQYEAENEAWTDAKDNAEQAYIAAVQTFTEQGLPEDEAKKEALAYYDAIMNSFDTKRLQIIEGRLAYTEELKKAMECALVGWNTLNQNER